MKISSMLSVAVVALAGLSWGDAAYSQNTFAMVKVLSTETNTLIAVPWTGYFTNGAERVDSLVDHIVKPENLTTGDMLLAVSNTHDYVGWVLSDVPSADGERRWQPSQIVERRVVLINSAVQVAGVSNLIARGYGLWLIRQRPTEDNGDPVPFYLEGQYATNDAEVVIRNVEAGLTNAVMVASPFCGRSGDFDINKDIVWDGVSIGEHDSLSVPNGSDAWHYCSWDSDKKKWYRTKYVASASGRKGSQVPVPEYNITVPVGCGFWYVSRGSDEVRFTFKNPAQNPASSD